MGVINVESVSDNCLVLIVLMGRVMVSVLTTIMRMVDATQAMRE
jgi:hypothetical protein